jgi:hypothetical protein
MVYLKNNSGKPYVYIVYICYQAFHVIWTESFTFTNVILIG